MRTSIVTMVTGAAAVLLAGAGSLFFAVGCGEDKPAPSRVEGPAPAAPVAAAPAPSPVEGPAAAPKAPEPEAPKAEDNTPVTKVDSKAGGTVTGTVKVTNPPRRKKVKMDADPKCAAMHAETPLEEVVVADAEGRVQWAFVYVKKGLEGMKFETTATPAVIDQKGCRYEPHVLGVMAGQDILIKNSDDLLHNIHALPLENREFNFGQPQKGMEQKQKFAKPEVMVKVKCDVHPWMSAWVGVVEHPYFSVTDPAGKYEIKGLPPGKKVTIEVWQEGYKSATQDAEVKDGETKTLDFTLTERKGG